MRNKRIICTLFYNFVRNHRYFHMKETLSSIAERTGFSTATISRVLNGQTEKYRISARTAEIILKEAERCNYSPDILARNLRTRKTNTIGLILPSVANPYFAELASVIIAEAGIRKFTTIVTDTMENEANEQTNITALISRGVDGIIVAPCGRDSAIYEEISRKHVPIILVDRYFENSTLPYVTTSNYRGGLEATEFLIRNGHRDIACIQGLKTSVPNKRRIAGFMDAMQKAGLEDRAVIAGNEFSLQNGYLETKLLLNSNPRPTAIFALSNTICLGVIKAVREAGMSIPEDISLVAFDNNIYMDYMTPSICRVSQSIEDMAKLSVKLLFDCIENKKRISTRLELSPQFIARNSVLPVPAIKAK